MSWLLALLRSTLHMVFMFVTVMPYAMMIVLASLFGASDAPKSDANTIIIA